jgi:hypothetical protein
MVIGDIEMGISQEVEEGLMLYREIGPGFVIFPNMGIRIKSDQKEKKEGQKGIVAFHGFPGFFAKN